MSSDKVKIWGAKTARSLRPIWMAEELEIDYELLPIGPRLSLIHISEPTRPY